jgi:uncharacterized protein
MTAVDIAIAPRSSSPEWPDAAWQAAMVSSRTWQPVPFQDFVLKVHSRCNLSCDYCYIYEMGDETWRARPGAMSREVLDLAARRIGEHVAVHGTELIRVVFHGGEPLLVGRDFIAYAARTLRDSVPAGVTVDLSVMTNGVLLDEEFLRVLVEHDIDVCVSIDGGRVANDRHRRYANGNGSYDAVVRALRLLNTEPYRRNFVGVIGVIDLDNDPVSTYEALLEFGAPSIDFLLPYGNWTNLPPRRDLDPGHTPYGDWLIAVFDRWYPAVPQETTVRILRNIINQILAGRSRYDGIGLNPFALIVIETNGTVEQVCSLKPSYDGAAATGYDIFRQDLDVALRHPGVVARQVGAAALCDTCQRCSIRDICGGGNYVQRYRAGTGYLNPSVYCADLFKLIGHVRDRVTADLRTLEAGAR